MNKKLELIAHWFSDVSKIFIATGIAKQIVEKEIDFKELLFGVIISVIMFIIAIMIQPKE